MITYSIIQKSQLEGAHRIDAEYYQPEYLEVVSKVSKIPHNTLESISESLLSFGAYSLTSFIQWEESGIPFITAEDVKEGFIDLENARFIDEKVDEILKKSRVHEGEVLLAMSGKVGDAAVAVNIPSKLNSNQDIVKIKLKKDYSPYFLAVFLNSKYGRLQVLRLPVGSVQQHIFLWQTKSLLIPKFSREFVSEIENLYKLGLSELQNSKILYRQAEGLLLEKLGLKNAVFENDLSYVVNFSDVKSANRVDAEYFQPKYEELVKKIKQKFEPRRLEEIASVKRGSLIDPIFYDDTDGIPYIRGKDFSTGRLEKSDLVYINNNFSSKNETKVKEGDIVFASIGSVGDLALIPREFAISFISNNTGKLSIKNKNEISPEYLTVVLHSIIGKSQFDKEASQTAQPKISDTQVRSFYIPILPKSTQQKIAEMVRRSHEARKKSKELLEEAKRKVEEMIEKSV